MSEPVIRIRNLRREFPAGSETIAVLRDIDLDIHAGEMIAIMGQSGSGKSTLMNVLGCLDRGWTGSYRLAGRDVATLSADELAELRREHFGFIFQRYQLLPDLDARENVEVPAIYAGASREARRRRVEELLGRLGLADRMTHRPGALSGGQQQRVSVARALMNGGDIILADEPTGALDSRSGRELLALLRELHGEGHTIIIVTRLVHRRTGRPDHRDRRRHDRRGPACRRAAAGRRAAARARAPRRLLQEHWDRFAEAFGIAWRALSSHRLRSS